AVRELNLQKGLTFHRNVRDAISFAKKLPTVHNELHQRELKAYHLNASHSATERTGILEKLTTNKAPTVVTNVKILGEGFDYNDLDFISIVNPKYSVIDIIQNIGRVMRRNGKGKVGTIILPVAVTSEGEIDSSSHATIFKVAAALKSCDAMLRGSATGV